MIDIITPWQEEMMRQGKPYIAARNNASSIGYPCERNLVYRRTAPSKQKSLEALERMIEGTKQHENVRAYLRQLGFVLTEDEAPQFEPAYQLSGHIEGLISKNGIKMLYEIKTCAPYTFDGIKTLEDCNKKSMWTKIWLDQCHTYMLMREYDSLLLILKNRALWKLKYFLIELDYDRADELLKKAERINEHIANKTLPDRIKYDVDVCGWCDYQYLCLPSIQIESASLIKDDPAFIELINQHEELREPKRKYDVLHKKIKELFKACGVPTIIAGDYEISNPKKMKIERI